MIVRSLQKKLPVLDIKAFVEFKSNLLQTSNQFKSKTLMQPNKTATIIFLIPGNNQLTDQFIIQSINQPIYQSYMNNMELFYYSNRYDP